MAGGVTLQMRQIGSYPAQVIASPADLLLAQPGGLGNPYASVSAGVLVSSALYDGPAMGVGVLPPGDARGNQLFVGSLSLPATSQIIWDGYIQDTNNEVSWSGGPLGSFGFAVPVGWNWAIAPSGGAYTNLMTLSPSGALGLPQGTLTVARDPGAAMEVATMGWVGRSTVTSFNGRQGAVTLNGCDIYSALCLDSTIATENWVNANIQASIQMLLANHPFVFGWNGRTGAVYLTLADISCVFFQPGQQPITQTPPLTSNDYSIPNTAWVVEYIANEFAGGGTTLATQQWVLANTVNSFNGRQGVVTLTSSDVFDVGAAPLNSPAFSGIPTAPTAAIGQATGQIATTAFVQMAISHNTAGVSTFNTRTGDVVLEAADITAAGGLTNPSANLTGNPTAPTQPPGTNLPVIATCEFVQAAIAAGTVTSFNTRTGAVTLTLADITGVGGAPIVSPAFSSVPTAPTAAPGTATVQLATCAFVANALATAGGVSSFNSRTGAVTLQGTDITAAGGALLASPAFTGAPTAPTAAPATNNSQIATTAYVTAAILADTTGVTSFNTRTGAVVLTTADITGAGGAPLASPSFTGVPLGPTATAGTSTTQLATTAFVQAAIASSGVSSFNARTGAVTLIANDISAAGGALLAGPTFTGVPAAPTATAGTNTTQLATTAFVTAAVGALGTGPFLPLAGGTMTGTITFSGNVGVSSPSGTVTANNIVGTTQGSIGGVSFAGSGNVNAPGTVTFGANIVGPSAFQIAASSTALLFFNGTANSVNPSTNNNISLGVPGSAWFQVASYNFPNESDPRLKSGMASAPDGAVEIVQAIPVHTFSYTSDATGATHHGFDATEVAVHHPNAIMTGEDEAKTLAINLPDMIAMLWKAVQELSAEVAALKGAPA